MKMNMSEIRVLLVIPFCVFLMFATQAQENVYSYDYVSIPDLDDPVNEDYVKKNPLGEEVSLRLALLREEYTWIEPGDLVDPGEKLIVEKPSIYYAVKKVNGYYKKAVKKDEIDVETASNDYLKILEVAIALRNQDTENLESELEDIKESTQIISLFTDRVVLN